jgi:PAS domain S-box-containing protein
MSVIRAAKQTVLHRISRQSGLMFAFLFILANSAFALLMVHQVRQANRLVVHTEEVMLALSNVREQLWQAGSGQRAYLFTRDSQYLTQYEQAERRLVAPLERLRALEADNAEQASRVSSLAMRTSEERQRLADGLSKVPAAPPSTGDLLASRRTSDDLIASIGLIVEEERRLLDERIAAADQRNVWTLLLVSLGTGISLIVIAMLLYRMRGEAHERGRQLAGTDAALRDSEQRFRRVFEASPLGILLVEDASKRIVEVNPAFCGMLGYEPDELIGEAIADITHIDDRDLQIDAGHGTARPGNLIETRYLTHSGAVTWARVRITPLSTSDRRKPLLLCLVEDITRQKQVEAELRQAQKMEAIGQLTGGIAHDFNNLLGVIIGNVEFLIDAVRNEPDHSELAKEILNSALSGADLTRRLLAFARRQTLQPRRIDLNTYLPNHIAILRRLLGETIQITTTLSDTLWPTRADPSQVGDALLNLAINARDAMPHGGRLTIETANAHLEAGEQDAEVTPGDYVVLSVTDSGTGMPPEVLERVLEPFFTTKGPGAGSGLGLSMIYGFARQSGGHLTIDSEPGRGTTVWLYLPRVQAAEETDGDAKEPLPLGDEAILLVDDNAEMRTVTRRHLASLGYRVSEAASGPAALAILQNDSSFDLMFTDIIMPDGMTGYQLAAVAQDLYPELKVLFTTGFARPPAGSETIVPRSGLMLRKPYRKQTLATSLRAALEA